MSKSLKYLLAALIGLTILGFVAARFGNKTLALGTANTGERDYLQAEVDSLNKRYQQLSSDLYLANISLYNANKQLEVADSIANGGNFIYLVTFQCTSIERDMVQDTLPNRTFDIVLPVAREFYNAVAEGNVLEAGIDYGFKYGHDILYGKHIAITNKKIVNNGTH